MKKFMSELSFFWGVTGVIFILSKAVLKLTPYVSNLLDYEFNTYHWLVLVLFTIFMGYAEGYKGFQKKLSPRVISRAIYLKNNPSTLRFVLAPFFCVGYFWSTKKRLITSYSVTAFIALLIIVVKQVPQPWRGIIDLGVIVGLSWGIIAIIYFLCLYLRKQEFSYPPETPDQP